MSRRVVMLFMPRFARKVEALQKPHTIRPRRKRPVRVGDLLDLREWLGKPYRSKQRKLIERPCIKVTPIRISIARELAFIRLGAPGGQTWLHDEPGQALARADGFEDVAEMVDWFKQTHGLPFAGVLIEWTP